jgi:hypothetical protein
MFLLGTSEDAFSRCPIPSKTFGIAEQTILVGVCLETQHSKDDSPNGRNQLKATQRNATKAGPLGACKNRVFGDDAERLASALFFLIQDCFCLRLQ